MEKINLENVIKSFFLGIFLGVLLLWFDPSQAQLVNKVVAVLASGSVGFIVGFLTEWLTAILPITLANARTYFFINNLIAVIITTLLMLTLLAITSSDVQANTEFMPILAIVLGVICSANLLDYFMYRRAQHKLKSFQNRIKDQSR